MISGGSPTISNLKKLRSFLAPFFVEFSTEIFFLTKFFSYICINQKEILNEKFNNLFNSFSMLFTKG